MTDNSHILFNKSLPQLRLLGARGGRTYGLNQRLRRALMPSPATAAPVRRAPGQTAAQASALLDAQFPWLRRRESAFPEAAFAPLGSLQRTEPRE